MSLQDELVRCHREIADREAGLRSGEYSDHDWGALLGLHDWHREMELIMKAIEKEKLVKFAGGAVSSPCARYELIPLAATTALAARFERGIRLKGDGAWNALSANQSDAATEEFVLNRLGHAIRHCQEAIARIAGTMPEADAQDIADGSDAGAIMFAGALLAEYKARQK
jgi:hypothetical protein